ncbi:MAG: DUF1684 domain-containing protein [Burkholderiales bacterium]|nr:DUF1684 domain-containing protein [Flavobacterium sp.]
MKKYLLLCTIVCFSSTQAQKKWTMKAAESFQKQINKEYADKGESPLTDEDFKTFKSLDFYPIDSKFAVSATFIKAENEKSFKMKTTGTRLPDYIKYGELRFIIDGIAFKLNIYQNIELVKKAGFEDYLFLPFSDQTCGKESYIGGRYIDRRFPKNNLVEIDFNTAYNPYCAYNHKYSCPIVPLENDLGIEIKAGVKTFHE